MIPSVRDLISQRAATGSLRSARSDPWHLALVVEGGGMRGVVAGGMVSALEERGLEPCFDSIHGSSAGACAGAYLAAGQARLGTRIFYEDVNSKAFIDLRRALVGRPIMNTHFLIDHVMRRVKILDVAKFITKPGLLHVVATEARTGAGCIFHAFKDVDHFFAVLKASITIPIVAGPPVVIDGVPLFDGGLVQQIAVQSALDVNATHILVLMTRKQDERIRPDRSEGFRIDHMILKLLHGVKLSDVYRRRNTGINAVLRRIEQKDFGEDILVESIMRPAGAVAIDRFLTDGDKLRQADAESRRTVFHYLDG